MYSDLKAFKTYYPVLIFQGALSLVFQMLYFRTLMEKYDRLEIVPVLALASLALWTACGSFLSAKWMDSTKKRGKTVIFLILASILTAAGAYVACGVSPLNGNKALASYPNIQWFLIVSVILPLPFGIINGTVYGLVKALSAKYPGRLNNYFTDLLGAVFGGVLFTLLLMPPFYNMALSKVEAYFEKRHPSEKHILPATLYPPIVFAALQPNRTNLKTLLFASPSSPLAGILSDLPVVSELATAETDQPNEKYDLIILSWKSPMTLAGNRFYSKRFYKKISGMLSEDGVFAMLLETEKITPESEGIILKTLKSVFPETVTAPGRISMIAAGRGKNLTDNFASLDQRLGRLMRNYSVFPAGIMSLTYSQKETGLAESEMEKHASESPVNEISDPVLSLCCMRQWSGIEWKQIQKYWLACLILLLIIYFLFRFLFSRKLDRRLVFSSLENGFFAMGMTLLSLFSYQASHGGLYDNLAIFLAIFFTGSAAGTIITGERIIKPATSVSVISVILPLMIPLVFRIPFPYIGFTVGAMLFINGIATGHIFSISTASSSRGLSSAAIWSSDMLGGAISALLLPALLLSSGSLLPCLLLLLISRLPVLSAAITKRKGT